MIIYHPLTDVYHSINRNLIILEAFPQTVFEKDRMNIYNYYLLFPQSLRKITLPNELKAHKKIKFQNKYNYVKNEQITFRRVSDINEIAINALLSHGLINTSIYKEKGIIKADDISNVETYQSGSDTKVLELYSKYFQTITLKELKRRTKLTEHRYEHS